MHLAVGFPPTLSLLPSLVPRLAADLPVATVAYALAQLFVPGTPAPLNGSAATIVAQLVRALSQQLLGGTLTRCCVGAVMHPLMLTH
eukprot:SAG11_NODE_4527_length_1864_cov_1.154108_1_plen_86_part_10